MRLVSVAVALTFLLPGLSGCLTRSHPATTACGATAEGSIDAALCVALDGNRPRAAPAPFSNAIVLVLSFGESKLPFAYDLTFDVDPDAIVTAMAAAHVAPPIAQAFATRLRARHAETLAAVENHPAHWHSVWIAPAVAERVRWHDGIRRRAPWRTKLQPLLARADLAAMTDTRRAYVEECEHAGEEPEWCLTDEVARPLTAAIYAAAMRAHLADLANAEARLLELPDRSTLGDAIRHAAERGARNEPGAAGYTLPGHGPWSTLPSATVATYALTRITIDRVEHRGDRAVLIARRGCPGKTTEPVLAEVCTKPTTIAPIEVPWDDASHVQPGEVASVMLGSGARRGHVVEVHGDRRALVQVRSFRLDRAH
jgi:hypothetical protein